MSDSKLLVVIGLDDPLVERLRDGFRARLGEPPRFAVYASPPPIYALDGRVLAESGRVMGRWLRPDGVLYYSYFEGAADARRALAIADTPSFPDVRDTLPLDDKVMALLAAMRDRGALATVPRGYVPAGTEVPSNGERVLKWGDAHCGEGKLRVGGAFCPEHSSVVEPFLRGESVRVLLVGSRSWQLHYASDDWRKNVRATVTVAAEADPDLVVEAQQVARRLRLEVAGIDFIVGVDGRRHLLEVNAYPGFDDAPGAEEAFVDLALDWWSRVAGA